MKILDLIFPQNVKCIFCSKEVDEYGICKECYEKLPFITGKTCIKCGGKSGDSSVCIECKNSRHEFEQVFSILEYSGDTKQKILAFKQNKRKNIGVAFSEIVGEYFEKLDISFDVILPVPIHENRLKERGYNQSEILLQRIDNTYGRVYKNIFVRTKDTPHQTGLSKDHRENNLKNAFKVLDKSKIKNKTVLLFDDVYTTGSTFDECAKTLKKCGAFKVYGLCLCRSPIKISKILNND